MYFEKAMSMKGARVQTAVNRMAECIAKSNNNGHTSVLVVKDSISVDEEAIAAVVMRLQEAGYTVEMVTADAGPEWVNPGEQDDCIKVTWE